MSMSAPRGAISGTSARASVRARPGSSAYAASSMTKSNRRPAQASARTATVASAQKISIGPTAPRPNQSSAIRTIAGSRSITVIRRGRARRRSRWIWVPPPSPTNSADGRDGSSIAARARHQYSRRTGDQSPSSG